MVGGLMIPRPTILGAIRSLAWVAGSFIPARPPHMPRSYDTALTRTEAALAEVEERDEVLEPAATVPVGVGPEAVSLPPTRPASGRPLDQVAAVAAVIRSATDAHPIAALTAARRVAEMLANQRLASEITRTYP